jgi:hypothetical protein
VVEFLKAGLPNESNILQDKVVNACQQGILKVGSIIVPLTSCFTGLEWSVFQIKIRIVSCHTADSKPVKQEVNGTVILSP